MRTLSCSRLKTQVADIRIAHHLTRKVDTMARECSREAAAICSKSDTKAGYFTPHPFPTLNDHSNYPASLKTKTLGELRWIIKDATEAMNAYPDGPKAGYYADEVSYAAMERQRRLQPIHEIK